MLSFMLRVFLIFFSAVCLIADEIETESLKEVPTDSFLNGDGIGEVLLKGIPSEIQGIVLIPNKESILSDPAPYMFGRVSSEGVAVPGGLKKLAQKLGPAAFNMALTTDQARLIEKIISSYFYQNGDPFVLVTIPKQDLRDGIVQVIVYHANIDAISVVGGRKGTDEKIRRDLNIEAGERVDYQYLDRKLSMLNRNPFRRVDLIYSPGKAPGTTDLTFNVNERRPYRYHVGANNTGVETTERQRVYAGLTFGKLFALDHIISFQYTSAYHPKRFQAYTLQYVAPTSFGPTLDFYGGYSTLSTVQKDPTNPVSKSKGKSYQASFRCAMPVFYGQGYITDCILGFDFKGTNNTLEFSELFLNTANLVNLTQICVGISQKIEKSSYSFDYELGLDVSPGKIIANQSNSDYAALRPNAKNHWVVGRGAFHFTRQMAKDFSFFLSGRGQLSSQNLLPSEQIGIGGFNTVRGYTERQLNYDSGALGTVELRSPELALLSAKLGKKVPIDHIQFLLFCDGGFGTNHNLMPGEPIWDYAVGAGPGLRYAMNPHIRASLDWGWKLHKQKIFEGGESMLYFDASISY